MADYWYHFGSWLLVVVASKFQWLGSWCPHLQRLLQLNVDGSGFGKPVMAGEALSLKENIRIKSTYVSPPPPPPPLPLLSSHSLTHSHKLLRATLTARESQPPPLFSSSDH
ncbi:hypothetical protein RIF29_06697 [Crotalaria pallida]|uniref:Uncharacterized protein n=1 Tax=Crotalaria pallida TaxID=3830 RepID=A0AAN9PB17_CROPI